MRYRRAAEDASSIIRTSYSQYTTYDGQSYDLVGSSTLYTDRRGHVRKIVGTVDGGVAKTIEINYDAADQLTGIIRTANAGAFRFDTNYQYDLSGRVTNISHLRPLASSIPFTSYSYEYGEADRINKLTTAHDSAISAFSALTSPEVEDFTFDSAGQLTVVNSNLAGEDESFD